MAKYKNGINGPFSGKIGPVTGSSWLGVPYIKSNSSIGFGRAPSIKQLNQRRVFGIASSWLKPMKHWIEIGYADAEGKTPMNAAISFVMKHVLSGTAPDFEIDYPKMVWSRGELLASLITRRELVDGLLRLEWIDGMPSFYSKADDKAVFVFYSPAAAQFAVFESGIRGDGETTLLLPEHLTVDGLHGWMFYMRDTEMRSTSVYFGAHSSV